MATISKLDSCTAQLHRARLSSDDFEEASQYIARARKTRGGALKRALLTAAIVAYARPFTPNSGGLSKQATSQLKVKLQRIYKPDERALHARLLTLRNEVVAHTDYKRKPVRRLRGTTAGFTMSGNLFDLLSERVDLQTFGEMSAALKGHCFTLMMSLNRKIVEIENAP